MTSGMTALAPHPVPRERRPRSRDGAAEPLRLLTFTTLFPNAAQPNHGVFVENRLRHLVGSGKATSVVLAPVPWFPWTSPHFGRWARYAGIPRTEERHGLTIHHPRFPAPPRLGMLTAPSCVYYAARRTLRQLMAAGQRFDAIDAHYLYPDGVAAIRLGKEFGLPVIITARGSDTSQLPNYRLPRRAIQRALHEADALIAVSAGLKEGLVALGAPAEKVTVLRNGVDLDMFRPPASREALRAELGLDAGPVLLSVGHLIERKGHHLVIEALPMLPDCRLLIVGEGVERETLQALVHQLGVADRVRWEGAQPHARLPRYYGAADILVLASSREGWANVLLEAMACGTPVITTPAWGSREAVSRPEAGLVVDEATPTALATAIRRLLASPPRREATRAYAETFSWDDTTAGQLALFEKVLS